MREAVAKRSSESKYFLAPDIGVIELATTLGEACLDKSSVASMLASRQHQSKSAARRPAARRAEPVTLLARNREAQIIKAGLASRNNRRWARQAQPPCGGSLLNDDWRRAASLAAVCVVLRAGIRRRAIM